MTPGLSYHSRVLSLWSHFSSLRPHLSLGFEEDEDGSRVGEGVEQLRGRAARGPDDKLPCPTFLSCSPAGPSSRKARQAGLGEGVSPEGHSPPASRASWSTVWAVKLPGEPEEHSFNPEEVFLRPRSSR